MKRGIVIFFTVLLITAAILAGGYFFVTKNQSRVSAQAEDNSTTQVESDKLFSFRGALNGILSEIKNEIQNIAGAVRNPFSNNSPTPTPEASSENIFSFAVIGDTQRFSAGNPNGNFQKVVKLISSANPDAAIAVGDLTGSCESYTECIKKHADWKKVAAPILSKTYAAMGNHDNVGDKGEKAWQDAFDFPTNGPSGYSEMAYSFDIKNSHFVVLDSDKPDQHQVDEKQRNWLEQDLTTNKKENAFVIFHEPAYSVSDKIGEGLDADPKERNALWEILVRHKVTAVFNGHEHIVSRKKIGNIYQFVFGSTDSFNHGLPAAGAAEYANQGQGRYGIVKVNGKEITVETYGPDGKTLNSFTFSH